MFNFLKRTPKPAKKQPSSFQPRRLEVEQLEDRLTPSMNWWSPPVSISPISYQCGNAPISVSNNGVGSSAGHFSVDRTGGSYNISIPAPLPVQSNLGLKTWGVQASVSQNGVSGSLWLDVCSHPKPPSAPPPNAWGWAWGAVGALGTYAVLAW